MNEFAESNKEHLKEMGAAGKLGYFRDYYLVKVLVGLGIAAVVIYMIYSYLRPQPVPVLRVAVFDNVEKEEGVAALTEELRTVLDAHDELDEIRFQTNYNSTNPNDLARLGVMATAQEIDAIAAPKKVFEEFAGYGYFQPLTDYLSDEEMKSLADEGLVVEAAGIDNKEGSVSTMNENYGKGKVLPYGISLKNSEKWAGAMYNGEEEFVIGIAAGALKAENVPVLIDLLTTH